MKLSTYPITFNSTSPIALIQFSLFRFPLRSATLPAVVLRLGILPGHGRLRTKYRAIAVAGRRVSDLLGGVPLCL